MEYSIINFDVNTGFITVLYNDIKKYKLTLMLPIIGGKYITGDELNEFINSYSPQNDDRETDISSATNIDEILSLIDIKGFSTYQREIRNNLLSETDYTQLSDFNCAQLKSEYIEYRKQLRDIPLTSGFPFNVVWPSKPQ